MDVTIPCICPPTADGERRHDRDTITLRDGLTFHDAIALQKDMVMAMEGEQSTGDGLAALTEGYMIRGVESWTLIDTKGKPIEVTREAIRGWLLSNISVAMDVSVVAEELYNPTVLLPLVERVSRSSKSGQTESSTSVLTDSPAKPRKPLKRSSTSTTRTDGIGTITSSPAGDSRSSPSATSAVS